MPVESSPEFEHFLALAQRGAVAGSSTSEKNCRKIAKLLVDAVPGLDDQALEGLQRFAILTAVSPSTARDLIK